MYNKALSKKIITMLGAAAMVIIVLLVLMIYTVLKDLKMTQAAVQLDDSHLQAITDAGFIKGEDGYAYNKEDISMSFEINTKGDKDYNYPHVLMIFASTSEDIASEQLIYDALNKVYRYTQTDTGNKKYELTLDQDLQILLVNIPGKKDDTDTTKQEEMRSAIIDKLEKFYNTFGFSAENALGFDCPQEVLDGTALNTTFGMTFITKFCTQSEGGYTYTSEDSKLQLMIFPAGGESYSYPYMTVIDKTLNANTTFVPQTNTILCNYAQGTTFISVAYDLSSDTIVLYKEGGLNKTEKYANDAVTKTKIKEIYNTELKNIQTIFNLSPDLLLRDNQPYTFTITENQNTETLNDEGDTTDENSTEENITEEYTEDSENP